MPEHHGNLLLVMVKDDQRLLQVLRQTLVGDVPDADHAVGIAARNDVVVERVPGQVQHRPLVTPDLRTVDVNAAHLQNEKGTDSDKLINIAQRIGRR